MSEPRSGTVEWIGVAPKRRAPMDAAPSVRLVAGEGIEGDRHRGRGAKRHVTLFQWEHLPVIAALCGRDEVGPELLRRNVAVRGLNLVALIGRRFRIGGALLEGTGPCDPCERMNETIGPGGEEACCGHGGINARVLEGAEVALGAVVTVEPGS